MAASVYTYDMLYFTDTHNSSISFYRFLTPQQKHVHGFRNLTLIQYIKVLFSHIFSTKHSPSFDVEINRIVTPGHCHSLQSLPYCISFFKL